MNQHYYTLQNVDWFITIGFHHDDSFVMKLQQNQLDKIIAQSLFHMICIVFKSLYVFDYCYSCENLFLVQIYIGSHDINFISLYNIVIKILTIRRTQLILPSYII